MDERTPSIRFGQEGVDQERYIYGGTNAMWVPYDYLVYTSDDYGPLFEAQYDLLSDDFMIMRLKNENKPFPTRGYKNYIDNEEGPPSCWRYQWTDRRLEQRKLW